MGGLAHSLFSSPAGFGPLVNFYFLGASETLTATTTSFKLLRSSRVSLRSTTLTMMAASASKSVVIDLVSSDEEDTPPPRARRRGFFRRESPTSSSRTVTPDLDPAPASRAPSPAPTAALRQPIHMASPPPAPIHALDDGAVGGANIYDPDDLDIMNVDDMLNFDNIFEMPGGYPEVPIPAAAPRETSPPQQGQIIVIDGEDVFIPDSPRPDRPQAEGAHQQDHVDQDALYAQETANCTSDVCLKRVLAMFPDIEHEHVVKLYNDYDAQGAEALPGGARLEAIVEKLLSGESYPRQAKPPPQLKRKREDGLTEQEAKRWEGPNREIAGPEFKGAMASILKVEFPEITKNAIDKALVANHHLYPAYLALAEMKDTCDVNKKWTGRPLKDLTSADSLATHCGWPAMADELEAARKHVKDVRRQRVIKEANKWAEQENLQRAMANGETAECQACFDDLPMNRQIHCDGDTAHFTCFDCATAYVKSEVGDSRCRVLCTAGCGASFARAQLHLLEDKALLEKLEQLQQEKDIREAGLDNLEECPFCDYKAILPPIDEDFEFRCANQLCEKVSCRRCKAVSHIPMSCEEHAKDHKLSSRHKIEEAMTKALIRNCAKCKKGFIKEYGCNKMSCPSCGNLQCYVCSESLKDYNHFDQAPNRLPGAKSTKCPLYDNVEERHEREIKVAEAAARAEVINENPDVSEQDLEIKVSDAVKKSTDERVKRAGAVPGGIPPGYGGFGAAGFPAGLFMPGGVRQRFRDRANDLEAPALLGDEADVEEDDGAIRAAWQDRRRRLMNGRANAVAQQAEGLRALAQNRPPRDAAPGPRNAIGAGLRGIAAALDPRAYLPAPQPAPPIPLFQEGAGGFNEDPFGGGDDGDPFALHRLFAPHQPPAPRAPALPVRAPHVGQANPDAAVEIIRERNRVLLQRLETVRTQRAELARAQVLRQQQRQQARAAPPQPIQQVALSEEEQLEQFEAQALAARQRFDDRRGGQGRVFRRDYLDPRRHHGPGGWPEQN